MMIRGRLAAVLAFVLGVLPATALADTPPSVWEQAKDPDAADAYALHRLIQQRLVRTGSEEFDDAQLATHVLPILERAGAQASKNPLLRFDLGFVYENLRNHARAAEIYKAAIADFPDHPAVERAWLRLAFACGHLGDHVCERNAYVKVLRLETEEVLRATPTLNLAETQMHLGELKDAIEGYREALRIAGRVPSQITAPLATWGLAVALDRAGDRIGAEKEARFALEIERSMGLHLLLRSKDVFFVPGYEVHWYEGLGSIARARVARSSRDAATLWRQAEKSFGEYVQAAERANANPNAKEKDRWLPIAKARLAQVKLERERAERNAPRETPPSLEPGPDVRL
jgi:tetratricopeptide (TPR) repeat protein